MAIDFLKDFLTPLAAACIGTAAGALSVQVLINQELEYRSKEKEIKKGNLLTAECKIALDEAYNMYINYLNIQQENKETRRLIQTVITTGGFVNINANIRELSSISIDAAELRNIAVSFNSSVKSLMATSIIQKQMAEISRIEKKLSEEYNLIHDMQAKGDDQQAMCVLYGIEYKGKIKEYISTGMENMITSLALIFHLLIDIVSATQEKQIFIKHKYESYNFRKLPDIIELDATSMKLDARLIPRSSIAYFDSFA